jgi:thiamine biosynthesis lipoprotein
MKSPITTTVLLLLATASCTPPPATTTSATTTSTTTAAAPQTFPTTVTLAGDIFASRWSVSIVADTATDATRAQTLSPSIQAALLEVERQLSSWRSDSEVQRFNRSTSVTPVAVSQATADVVATCLDVSARTDGAFDVTVGPLLALWGFSPSTKGTVAQAPSADAINEALAHTGWRRLHAARGSLTKDHPALTVDVTAVTDGQAADVIARLLRERGHERFLVDVAGEVVVAGQGLRGPWRVGINTPSPDAGDAESIRQTPLLPPPGETVALSTSGTYREGWTDHGTRVSHILNPTTGAPVAHSLVSCTIIGTNTVVADALSTACVVLGEAETRRVLPRFQGCEALFITADGPRFVVTTSAGFPADVTPVAQTP